MRKIYYLQAIILCVCINLCASAQGKLEIENVRSTYLRNSGSIIENNEIKGYYAFYLSDKVDRKTNEYTLQIIDENLNKVKDIVFEDDKNIKVLESSYNGSSVMFLFYNSKEKTLEYRAYGFDGKQKSTYTKELNKRSKALLEDTYGTKSEDGQNEALFDIQDKGYVTIYPVKEGKYISYEVNYFFTDRKKQWTYEAAEEQEDKMTNAIYLGNTDSLLIFEVIKQKTLLAGRPHSWLLALDMYTGKKAFELLTESEEDFKFYPMNISAIAGKSDFVLMGSYYDKDAKIMKDPTLGIAAWTLNGQGKIIAKKYNSWETEIAKYLPVGKKGKVDDLGFVYFHKVVQAADGNYFAIGEGYKKVVSAAGVAMQGLSLLARGNSSNTLSAFKVKVTDMLIMKFNSDFEIKAATIYDKFNNSIEMPAGGTYMSPHTLALLVKSFGGFDYEYTKTDKNTAGFITGYSDYEKDKDYKGLTFNTITYAGDKLTTDQIKLNTKAKSIKVFPAKTGSVMVMEYFKKEKRLDFHLEKMN